jgi:hypothetical protein
MLYMAKIKGILKPLFPKSAVLKEQLTPSEENITRGIEIGMLQVLCTKGKQRTCSLEI